MNNAWIQRAIMCVISILLCGLMVVFAGNTRPTFPTLNPSPSSTEVIFNPNTPQISDSPIKTIKPTLSIAPTKTPHVTTKPTATPWPKNTVSPHPTNSVTPTPAPPFDQYELVVHLQNQVVTAFGPDANGNFTIPVRSMVCSTGASGSETLPGNFSIKDKTRWKPLNGDVWGQYASRFDGGRLFHSVPYSEPDYAALYWRKFNKLGTRASSGCIRLQVMDAKWIYDNCARGTKVRIVSSGVIAGMPIKVYAPKVPVGTKWDPTDPNPNNPWIKTPLPPTLPPVYPTTPTPKPTSKPTSTPIATPVLTPYQTPKPTQNATPEVTPVITPVPTSQPSTSP